MVRLEGKYAELFSDSVQAALEMYDCDGVVDFSSGDFVAWVQCKIRDFTEMQESYEESRIQGKGS